MIALYLTLPATTTSSLPTRQPHEHPICVVINHFGEKSLQAISLHSTSTDKQTHN